jgi:hypothetical protein
MNKKGRTISKDKLSEISEELEKALKHLQNNELEQASHILGETELTLREIIEDKGFIDRDTYGVLVLCLNASSLLFKKRSDYRTLLLYLNKILKLETSIDCKRLDLAVTYLNIGTCHHFLGQTKQSFEETSRAKDILVEEIKTAANDKGSQDSNYRKKLFLNLVLSYFNRGVAAHYIGLEDKQKLNFKQSLELATQRFGADQPITKMIKENITKKKVADLKPFYVTKTTDLKEMMEGISQLNLHPSTIESPRSTAGEEGERGRLRREEGSLADSGSKIERSQDTSKTGAKREYLLNKSKNNSSSFKSRDQAASQERSFNKHAMPSLHSKTMDKRHERNEREGVDNSNRSDSYRNLSTNNNLRDNQKGVAGRGLQGGKDRLGSEQGSGGGQAMGRERTAGNGRGGTGGSREADHGRRGGTGFEGGSRDEREEYMSTDDKRIKGIRGTTSTTDTGTNPENYSTNSRVTSKALTMKRISIALKYMK